MSIARRSLAVLAACCLTTLAAAQEPATRVDAGILGLSLTMSGTARDTLGLLVAAVSLGGPAERAGIVQGNRVAELAGVSLRVDPSDIGQRGIEDQMARRLARALRSLQSGEETSVRIITGTRERSVQVTVGTMGVANVAASPRDGAPLSPAPIVNTILPQPTPTAPIDNAIGSAIPTTTAPSLPSVTDGLDQQRALLRRLARSEDDEAKSDSLFRVEQELRGIVRRLHALQGAAGAGGGSGKQKDQQQTSSIPTGTLPGISTTPTAPVVPNMPNAITAATPPSASTGGTELPGLRFAPVAPELVSVVGPGTEGGLFVFFADSTWSPVQSGDVILRVDGQNVDASRLRAAITSREPAAFEVIRQRRRIIVTLHGGS